MVVGLVCCDGPRGYAVELLTPDRSKVRFQTRPSGTRGLTPRMVEVRFRGASARQTCLCKRTSDGITPEEDLLKNAKLESATAPYLAHCLPEPREPFKRDIVDLAPRAIEGVGGVFSQ